MAEDQFEQSRSGVNLAPFAGIAFLWFIGVLRDRLGGAALLPRDSFFRAMPPKNRVAEALEIINSVNLDKFLNRLKTLTPVNTRS
jgi:hypothetical protein